MLKSFNITLFITLSLWFSQKTYCQSQSQTPVGTPYGFAEGVTGGGNAKAETPQTEQEVIDLLSSKEPKVIHITKMFDFTKLGKEKKDKACTPWKECTNGNKVQYALNILDWCTKDGANNKVWKDVTYNDAALEGIKIRSDKTILGVGKDVGFKGKGLTVKDEQNIIIKNVIINFLNPHLVWGGDAIALSGASKLWVDHCTIRDIGRQMVSASHSANKGITFSNNLFDGKTKFSNNCNNKHYWGIFLRGEDNEITVANNCMVDIWGRDPKVGGLGKSKVHFYNNLITGGGGPKFEILKGGTIVAEGNAFKDDDKTKPKKEKQEERAGSMFVAFSDSAAKKCQQALGRPCEKNEIVGSSSGQGGIREDTEAVEAFKSLKAVSSAKVLPVAQILKGPPGGCGAGTSGNGTTDPNKT